MTELLGIFGWSAAEKIADLYLAQWDDDPRDRAEITRLVNAILPSYQQAVAAGYPVFIDSDNPAVQEKTRSTWIKVTNDTGIEANMVYFLLYNLEYLAKQGTIDPSLWNPTIPKKAGIVESVKQTIAPVIPDINPLEGLERGFNKILIAATAVVIVVAIYDISIRRRQVRR